MGALGITLSIQAGLGVSPWTVFHMGISDITGLSVGRITQLVGVVLVAVGGLLLRQKPGIGTVINMILIGFFVDFYMGLPWPELHHVVPRLLYLLSGVTLIGMGTGMYISTNFGAGPRDTIMLGLSRILHRPVGSIRSAMELTVLIVGFFMGGPVGFGTVFTVLVGPVVQFSLGVMRRYWEVHWGVQQRHA